MDTSHLWKKKFVELFRRLIQKNKTPFPPPWLIVPIPGHWIVNEWDVIFENAWQATMHNTRQSKDKAATNNHCCVIISMDFRFYLVHFSARETSSCTEVVHVWEVFFVLGVFSRTVLLFDSIVNCRTTLNHVTEYGPKSLWFLQFICSQYILQWTLIVTNQW